MPTPRLLSDNLKHLLPLGCCCQVLEAIGCNEKTVLDSNAADMHVFVQDGVVDCGGELRVGEVEGRESWGREVWGGGLLVRRFRRLRGSKGGPER